MLEVGHYWIIISLIRLLSSTECTVYCKLTVVYSGVDEVHYTGVTSQVDNLPAIKLSEASL